MKTVDLLTLQENPFDLIGKQWMLITAGDETGYNTMTASWGGLGVLWNKNVATVYIRPQRYTKTFVDRNDTFTLSVFDESYRKALAFCGSKSGRDVDKAKETGLTPWFTDGSTAFKEAKLVLICKKLYEDDLKPDAFLEQELIGKNYPDADFHRFYIAEIVKVYENK